MTGIDGYISLVRCAPPTLIVLWVARVDPYAYQLSPRIDWLQIEYDEHVPLLHVPSKQ
jgi:hypothetical protein